MTRRALWIYKWEAELLRDAAEYWGQRLATVGCESAPHKAAGATVSRQLEAMTRRLDALFGKAPRE